MNFLMDEENFIFFFISAVAKRHVNRSRIHECTIALRFLSRILRVLRLEFSVYNVYIINQFQSTFALEGGGGE
jgi:hypothetical protein